MCTLGITACDPIVVLYAGCAIGTIGTASPSGAVISRLYVFLISSFSYFMYKNIPFSQARKNRSPPLHHRERDPGKMNSPRPPRSWDLRPILIQCFTIPWSRRNPRRPLLPLRCNMLQSPGKNKVNVRDCVCIQS